MTQRIHNKGTIDQENGSSGMLSSFQVLSRARAQQPPLQHVAWKRKDGLRKHTRSKLEAHHSLGWDVNNHNVAFPSVTSLFCRSCNSASPFPSCWCLCFELRALQRLPPEKSYGHCCLNIHKIGFIMNVYPIKSSLGRTQRRWMCPVECIDSA